MGNFIIRTKYNSNQISFKDLRVECYPRRLIQLLHLILIINIFCVAIVLVNVLLAVSYYIKSVGYNVTQSFCCGSLSSPGNI